MTLFKGPLPIILIGIGAAVAAPVVIPALAAVGRPLAKGAIKGVLLVTDQISELAAEVGEQWSDLVAEAQAERSGAVAAAGDSTGKPRPARV